MNLSKTRIIYNQHVENKEIIIRGEIMCIVDKYIYLRQLKSSKAKLADEVNRSCTITWSSFENYILFSKRNYQCISRV